MPTRAADAMADYIRERIDEGPSAASAANDDPLETLRKLAELRDAGVISAEEYEAKKASLLDRV